MSVRSALLFAVSLLALAGCGSSTTSPADDLKAQAAAQFEKLDNTYFKANQGAVAKGRTIAPDAYEQAMGGVADANHAFAQGLQQIPFPESAQTDAKALLAATVQVELDAVLESHTLGSSKISADLDTRNAADRKLRLDVGLDPAEAPGG